jgi:subtilisin family serine protease
MIAVIDSGVTLKRLRQNCRINGISIELKNDKLHFDEDYEDSLDHGTNVLNILNELAAERNYLMIKILDDHLRATVDQLVEGIRNAIDWQASIINLSCGDTVDSEDLRDITRQCYQKGIVIVASFCRYYQSYPASYPWVIGVASELGSREPELVYRENHDIEFAVKWEMEMEWEGQTRVLPQPASYACPIVTGLVSRIVAKNPNADVEEVRQKLMRIAENGRSLKMPKENECPVEIK